MSFSKNEHAFVVKSYFIYKSYTWSKTPQQILHTIVKFLEIRSVADKKSPGRPSLLTANILDDLNEQLTCSPRGMSFEFLLLLENTGFSTAHLVSFSSSQWQTHVLSPVKFPQSSVPTESIICVYLQNFMRLDGWRTKRAQIIAVNHSPRQS